jgi:flagellar motor switch protein FliN
MSEEESKQPEDAPETVSDDWAEAMEEQAEQETADEPDAAAGWEEALQEQETVEAVGEDFASAEFQELSQQTGDSGGGEQEEEINLDVILDVPVTISMEIGRTRINIRNLLQLNQGSVVELDRLAGEPMDVLVNGTLIAHGEVVVVNDKFGIRLTDVISPSERVRKLT